MAKIGKFLIRVAAVVFVLFGVYALFIGILGLVKPEIAGGFNILKVQFAGLDLLITGTLAVIIGFIGLGNAGRPSRGILVMILGAVIAIFELGYPSVRAALGLNVETLTTLGPAALFILGGLFNVLGKKN